ncbi:hypothetical protein GLE_0139 [Lysobacter enzymogenes]|uniref:Uncharacterized protein n=1 Tax=Lysobacter enzymogenes TaxID=69 RepID=A0A0S2DAF3_LYSEN|nr:hypothetical protein GLE_0139 [Lysobacter enzymogenes]
MVSTAMATSAFWARPEPAPPSPGSAAQTLALAAVPEPAYRAWPVLVGNARPRVRPGPARPAYGRNWLRGRERRCARRDTRTGPRPPRSASWRDSARPARRRPGRTRYRPPTQARRRSCVRCGRPKACRCSAPGRERCP